MNTLSITEARKRLPELVNKVYLNSKSFTITKGGIEMAKIVRADESSITTRNKKKNIQKALKLARSIKWIWDDKKWKNKSSVEIANYLREKAWNSHAS
ncbi:hypothetical protein A2714_03415 [Candidatus Woesebacteria bacterium RIFCSPHIGHO2_01_FULL_38_9]|uniref:Antitoxin n=2 Tax=Candidatus Woeseibacteriota TaxID=1752722 RepID=A0A1F7Y2D0_9BACT|nr:MAG: hypothetical protein A2714_03415 [Candidatus Woesebacteria bacterium RIFCSPHIGHO2_01_FULL_38_9]OGM63893.1 MAG: hypothetical protein A2893_00050 [Candidatus Woesebacteria bacterium RIFCSPLOWO2_01_FULL_39_25]